MDFRIECRNEEKRKSKIKARQTCARENEDEVVPRRGKFSSNSIRKESKCQQVEDFLDENESTSTTSYSSEDVSRNIISSSKTREDSLERGKPRETLIRPVKREEPSISGRTVRPRGSNEISDRVVSAHAKNEATRTFAKPKRSSKIADEFLVEKSIPESASKNKASVRKQSSRDADDGNRKSSKEHEKSKIETECAAIRHALGLSTPYCNCASTGSTLRRVRRKRISRGVQCTEPLNLKNKRSGCLRGCFAFKCCLARTKNSERKRLGNAAGNGQHSAESSDTYKPKNNRNEKKHEEPREKIEQDSRQADARTRRIGGGAERPESAKRSERYPRRQAQDVIHVKKRLNECLIELNGIIGDVAYMFKKSNETR